MKIIQLNKIAAIIFFTCSIGFAYAQNVSGKIWVTIEDQNVLPANSSSEELVSSDIEFNNLIQTLNVTEIKKAFPSSRKASLLKVYEITSSSSSAEMYMEAVNNVKVLSGVEYAPEYTPLYTPNDYTTGSSDYALDLINAKDAWDITHGSDTIIIGISDQNYTVTHEELLGKVSYYDANNTALTTHGTSVAIIAAGNTDNSAGTSSIGFDSKLALYRMTYNDLLVATYAGIKVLNLSWTSGCTYSQYSQDIINEIYLNGTFIIASAGNGSTCGGASNHVYPASFDNVFSVTSIGSQDNHEKSIGDPNSTHQHNDMVDLCAPGYDVKVLPDHNWELYSSGTSFAAPFVSGTVALMMSVNPCLDNQDIELILKTTAVNIDALNPSFIGKIGSGRLDAYEAVLMASEFDKLVIDGSVQIACTATSGAISITGSAGMAPYSADWGNGLTGMSINGLSAGTYTVVLTDSQGCFADSTFVVDAATPLATTSVITDVTCATMNDGSVDVTITSGNPSYTYQWDNGATTEDIIDLTAGTYRLTVVDGDGCKTYASYNVLEPTLLEATMTHVDPNSSALGSIDLTVNGGTPTYTYDWNNGEITEDIIDLSAGYYEVTITDANGCQLTIDTDLQQTSLSSIGELTARDVNVYPNPVTDNATISWGGNNIDYLMVTNVNGQVVTNQEVSMINTYGISNLTSGVYMINLITKNNERLTKKFIVL